ncbi:MAG TPA: heme-binding domain-containing protein [Candidatus Angelobacter sp.]
MKRWLKRGSLALLALLVVIQVIRPARTNPPVDPKQEIQAVAPVDPVVQKALGRSCNDCHSNRTVWPWYSNVAPASWLVARDVNEGRSELNFSEWGGYQVEKQHKLLGKICEEAREGEMPVRQYLLAHPDAQLTSAERQAFCTWSRQLAQTLPGQAGQKGHEEHEEDDD